MQSALRGDPAGYFFMAFQALENSLPATLVAIRAMGRPVKLGVRL